MSFLAADAASLKAIIANLVASYPELAEDETLRADMIEAETDINSVLARAVREKSEADHLATAIKEHQAELGERRARFERKSEAMRRLIRDVMEVASLPKVILPEATLSVRDPSPTVDVIDVDALPQGYFRTSKIADKAALKQALLSGEEIPGAVLTLGESSVTIRTK